MSSDTENNTPVTTATKMPRASKAPKSNPAAAVDIVRRGRAVANAKGPEETGKVPGKLQSKIGKPSEGEQAGNNNNKKKRRFRSGMRALQQIRKLQKGTEFLIRRLPFQRLIREIAQNYSIPGAANEGVRWQASAINALQEASEAYLIAIFSTSYLLTLFAKRNTLGPKEFGLALKIAGSGIAINSERAGTLVGV